MLKALWAVIAALLGGLWFGGPRKPKTKEDADASSAPEPPPRPFASFANPFDAGLDRQLTPDDLVVYSFEALEAWAYEHDLGRSPHETPTEFARRLGKARPELGADAARLASYLRHDHLRPARLQGGDPAVPPKILADARGGWSARLRGARRRRLTRSRPVKPDFRRKELRDSRFWGFNAPEHLVF